jgi:hypothetical protein
MELSRNYIKGIRPVERILSSNTIDNIFDTSSPEKKDNHKFNSINPLDTFDEEEDK